MYSAGPDLLPAYRPWGGLCTGLITLLPICLWQGTMSDKTSSRLNLRKKHSLLISTSLPGNWRRILKQKLQGGNLLVQFGSLLLSTTVLWSYSVTPWDANILSHRIRPLQKGLLKIFQDLRLERSWKHSAKQCPASAEVFGSCSAKANQWGRSFASFPSHWKLQASESIHPPQAVLVNSKKWFHMLSPKQNRLDATTNTKNAHVIVIQCVCAHAQTQLVWMCWWLMMK